MLTNNQIILRRNIKDQIKFCNNLMLRLEKDCLNNVDKEYPESNGKTRLKNDAIRLRRELNVFVKLVERL